ncbi:MAG: DNA-directed RNA polymerase subunit omega [Planctomycetota bacterium]|jgi:DNA-directed RNA polymerase subunit omega
MGKKVSRQEATEKAGGRFKLTSLLQKRYRELLLGSRPLVDIESDDILDILIAEVAQDKTELVPESEAIAAAAAALLGDTGKKAKGKEKGEEKDAEEEGGEQE